MDGRGVEHHVRFNLFNTMLVFVVGLGTSLVTSTAVASRAYRDRPLSEVRKTQQIAVKGFAKRSVRSDQVLWRVEVSATDVSLQASYAQLEASVQKVSSFLLTRELASEALTHEAVATRTLFARDSKGRQTEQVTGYQLSQALVVHSQDLERVRFLAGSITSLIRDGVLIRSHAPEFTLTDPSALKREILEAATADARSRAEGMAERAGCVVGEVRTIKAGVMQITRPSSTEVASYGIYDTGTIDKEVSVPVTVTFAIEPS